jgi:hypothetical protein
MTFIRLASTSTEGLRSPGVSVALLIAFGEDNRRRPAVVPAGG